MKTGALIGFTLLVGLALAWSLGLVLGQVTGVPGAHTILSPDVALADAIPKIERWVFASGGGSVTVGNSTLDGIIGQAVVGGDESDGDFLGHGFWGSGEERYLIHLPLILRDTPWESKVMPGVESD